MLVHSQGWGVGEGATSSIAAVQAFVKVTSFRLQAKDSACAGCLREVTQ